MALLSRRFGTLQNKKIALYSSAFGELGTALAIKNLDGLGVWVYLPKIMGNRLVFIRHQPHQAMTAHALGVKEPNGNHIHARALDAIIMPLVLVNEKGARMGLGGGFYDRTLTDFKGYKIGYGHDFQYAPFLPNAWDIRVHALVCPQKTHIFCRG